VRFGPKNPRCLIIGLRGGWPQRVESGCFGYPSFREMSQLEELASERRGRAVIMPDDNFSIYGMDSVQKLREILNYEQPIDAYLFAFSKNASVYVETISRHIQFDGAVICSGVNPPTFGDQSDQAPRLPVKSIVLHGSQEKCGWFGLRSCRATADVIEGTFGELGDCTHWIYPALGGRAHRWPAELNGQMLRHFGEAT
jgi:hypothetical protein